MSEAFPTFVGYPVGWFALGFSDELPDGARRTAFGRPFVCRRDDDDTPRIVERFGRRELPAKEQDDVVFVWHHPEDAPPGFDFPRIAGYGTPEWTKWITRPIDVRTQPREVIENIVDQAHFGPVHHADLTRFEVTFAEQGPHTVTQITEATGKGVHGGVDTFVNRATYYGPGVLISEMHGMAHTVMLASHYPIDEQNVHFSLGLTFEWKTAFPVEKHRQFYAATLIDGFLEDVKIWEHKKYLERPHLCDGVQPHRGP